jgi:hypothetical protein
MSRYGLLRAIARGLDQRAAVMDDGTLPAELKAVLNRCREDLALILAATEPEALALLTGGELIESFEALRGLVRRQ